MSFFCGKEIYLRAPSVIFAGGAGHRNEEIHRLPAELALILILRNHARLLVLSGCDRLSNLKRAFSLGSYMFTDPLRSINIQGCALFITFLL